MTGSALLRRGVTAIAVALTVAGWAVLVRAVFVLPPSTDPMDDLEAGGGLAANVDMYWPGFLLTCALLVVLPLALLLRSGTRLALVAALSVAAFGLHVGRLDYLLAYLPGLRAAARQCAWLAGVAALVALAWLLVAPRAFSADPTPAETIDTP